MIDQLYEHLVDAWSLKCVHEMWRLLRSLVVMSDDELKDLYQELLS